MSSQKSTAATPREPKRQRGHLRVAAILEAGAALFAEKGYDGATMTEIAARAETAIGSLYRFFPTKEVLAQALLARYGEKITAGLDSIAARAAGLSAAVLADALVDLMRDLQAERAAAIVLLDAGAAMADTRTRLRTALRRRLAAILAQAAPRPLPAVRTEAAVALLLHLLKALPALAQEPPEVHAEAVGELRAAISLYLGRVIDGL